MPKENAGRRPTLERPRNLEEKGRLEEEKRQRDDEWRREWKERRKTWQVRNEREENEEEEERDEERERQEARRWQLLNGLMLQQLEQNLVSAAMSWAVSYVEAPAETRAEALWRKRLRWWRHADASTSDKSFKRKIAWISRHSTSWWGFYALSSSAMRRLHVSCRTYLSV